MLLCTIRLGSRHPMGCAFSSKSILYYACGARFEQRVHLLAETKAVSRKKLAHVLISVMEKNEAVIRVNKVRLQRKSRVQFVVKHAYSYFKLFTPLLLCCTSHKSRLIRVPLHA